MAPRLSLVVPVYNVERYLGECLDSIAAQTFEDFECVMVDDGSTDDGPVIAKAYAARDRRFRLVQQENKGLGAARNTGWRHLTPGTEYLAFVDSDDTLPPHAYELMIGTLDETGSDFAAGNAMRLRTTGLTPSHAHRRPFRETRLRTHIRELPALVTDRTAWNKVYRRSFFDAAGILYPEGILYEDAPVSVPHHFLAERVDVLADPIYHWRVREGGDLSITQKKTDPRGLIDRVRSMELVREWLLARPEPEFAEHLRAYDHNCLVEEIPMFFWSIPDGDRAYWEVYQRHVSRLLRAIGPARLAALNPQLRLKYRLTLGDHLNRFVAVQRLHRLVRRTRQAATRR
ncbi:glycosyltransferase family 2 protein [Kitasatospora sp. SUK 42]|uniref:glycosyltransferase family 2 protein n=1 Tax=Kitasatospora sp. SUK 42 TaxID=1588882 RepID=UPI0018C8D784|nr:glycosyltransferase family 2 protein [Kitasatospora sp. SUK 42]MBV2155177.1 glycosyltransferase [Kitasatospora sp. SUK 42]